MNNNNFKDYFRKRFIVFAATGLLLTCLSVALMSIWPLYKQLQRQHINNLIFAVKIRSMVVEEFMAKIKETARQVTSRSKAREALEKYNQKQINLSDFQEFISPILQDALNLSKSAVGISRFDLEGNQVVQVGLPLPNTFPEQAGLSKYNSPVVHGLLAIKGKTFIVVSAPIVNRNDIWVGTDIILFKTAKLLELVQDYTSLGESGESILLGTESGVVGKSLFPSRTELQPGLSRALQKIAGGGRSKTVSFHETENDYIAYGQLKNIGWLMIVRMEKDELYEPINKLIKLILLMVFVMIIPLGLLGLVVLLRPLRNRTIIHFDTLENEITTRKQAEEELQKARNYIKDIIDSMPSVLIGVDINGRVTQWNRKAQLATGLPVKNALGQPLSRVFPRMTDEMERVHKAIASCTKQSDVKRAWQEDGETYYEDVTVYPLFSNGVEGAVIRIDDVTERVRIEEMIVQSEKMLSVGGLAAGMAHEINNPLGGMMQASQVLNNRLTKNNLPANIRAAKEAGTTMEAIQTFIEKRKIADMLGHIRESGSRVAKIVANMLTFARKSDSLRSSHNIADLLDQCVELSGVDYDLKKKYNFRQIKIIREYEENLPFVLCESGKIQQVLMNILRNGAEAMQEEPDGRQQKLHLFVLRLAYEHKTRMVYIEIEDNGPGMDEKIRKRVFEPFFTTKPAGLGTGLGLSVSYFIITENHNGEMSVESKPGEGSKFIIGLPAEWKQGCI